MGTAAFGSVFSGSCGRCSRLVLGGSGMGCTGRSTVGTVVTAGTVDSVCTVSGSCGRNRSPAKTSSAAKG